MLLGRDRNSYELLTLLHSCDSIDMMREHLCWFAPGVEEEQCEFFKLFKFYSSC